MAPIRSGAWLASFAAAAVLAGCSPKPKDTPPSAPPAEAPAVGLPVPPPTLVRRDILDAVAKAASAFSVGQGPPAEAAALSGRRFVIHMPFGCLGPQTSGAARYAYDGMKGSLKLTARAETWTEVEEIRSLVATPQTEAIEGFWIPRPWIATDACPTMRPPVVPTDGDPASPPPFPPTVGLVSTFESGDSRLQRRGVRAYEVVRKADAPPSGAFRLLLEGRIVDGVGGPVVCRSDDPDRPPVCLVRVEFERVAIESDTGDLFGEWR